MRVDEGDERSTTGADGCLLLEVCAYLCGLSGWEGSSFSEYLRLVKMVVSMK